eukprot:g26490.t1
MFHVRGRLMVVSGNEMTSCNEPETCLADAACAERTLCLKTLMLIALDNNQGNSRIHYRRSIFPSLVAKTRMKADAQRVPGLDTHNAFASVGAFVMYVSGAARPCRGFGCCELSFAVCFDAYLKPTNTGSYDYFGWDVSVSGNTLVVGSDAGAAYVFVRNEQTGQWFQQVRAAAAQSVV